MLALVRQRLRGRRTLAVDGVTTPAGRGSRARRHDMMGLTHKIAKVLVEIARSLNDEPDQDLASPTNVLVSDPTCRDQTPDTDEPPTSA